MGIAEPTAGELAKLPHVTTEYLEEWAGYLGYQEAGGNHLGTGWLIEQIRAARPIPPTPVPEKAGVRHAGF
jgi:hypothetical protein